MPFTQNNSFEILRAFRRSHGMPSIATKGLGPYYLTGKTLFASQSGREVFVKKISTGSPSIPRRGPVLMVSGVACNGNLFRLKTDDGELLSFAHNRSFANLLAAQGFPVYLWHYPSSELVYNRYVSRYCPESAFFGRRYSVSPALNFDQLVNLYLPMVVNMVARDAGTERLSYLGFSMGGMLAYAYLARFGDERIRNLVTIGSPVTISPSMTRLITNLNRVSKLLGAEEKTVPGAISEHLNLFASLAAFLPGDILRTRLFDFLYNPGNVNNNALRAFFSRVIEPIPSGLENSFDQFIREGFVSLAGDVDYYAGLKGLGKRPDCLFIAGAKDKVALVGSVRRAQQALTPREEHNLVIVKESGHNDLVIGNNSEVEVWERSLDWLIANNR